MQDDIKKFLAAEYPGEEEKVNIEIQVEEGYPAQTILTMAEKQNADIIVMSSRTHGTIGQVIGSTTNKVIHHGKFPVLVLPYY
jgi:nucleotide-binding universal stress UspA family protein